MGLVSQITGRVSGTYTKAADFGSPAYTFDEKLVIDLLSGTGNGKADIVFTDERTIAASSNDDLDLAGVLADIFGATITAAKIKAIIIFAAAGNTNNVVIGGAASNAVPVFSDATDKLPLKPGNFFALTDKDSGITVTAGTGDILRIANSGSGTSVTYKIVILAASA